ncbi:MAG TPA: CHAT domain-containing protein [Thermoanaerobaculia bacterium]|nr:CHAT domain-containing protein [Thermoanaerobaculia bacterium]
MVGLPAILRILLASILAFSFVPAYGASNDKIMAAGDAFVAAMHAGTLAAFEPLSDVPVSHAEWKPIRELIETSKCINVHSHRTIIDKRDDRGATIIVDVDALRLTRGAVKDWSPVPSSWVLELACGADACRIHSVLRRERVVARAIVAAPADQRWRIIREAHVDESALARDLAEEALLAPIPYEKDPVELERRRNELFEFARELARHNGDRAAEAYCFRQLSIFIRIHARNGIPAAEEGVELARLSGDADAIAEAIFTVGLARWGTGDSRGAIEDLRTASSTLDQLRDPRLGLKALAMKSYIAIQYGQLRQGLATAQQLREESVRYGWIEGEASAAGYLGWVHNILKAPEIERTYQQTSYRKALEARDARNEVYALKNLALCDYLADDFEGAILGFRRAVARLDFDPNNKGLHATVRGGLALALLRAGRPAEAGEAMRTVLEDARKADPASLTNALTILAEFRLAQGRPHESLAAANEALEIREKTRTATDGLSSHFNDWAWTVEAAAGRALRSLGRTSEAERAFRRSIALIEAQRSQISAGEDASARYFEHKVDPYAELAQILAAQGRSPEALQISERVRARALTMVLEQGKIDLSASMTDAEKERERELNTRLSVLNQTLLDKSEDQAALSARDAVRVELDRFRDELYLSRPALRIRRPFSDDAVTIPPSLAGTVFVEYIVRDPGVVVVTARRGSDGQTLTSAKFIHIPLRRLNALTNSLLRTLENRDAGYQDRARKLYDLLLLPVEEQTRRGKRVCIIPDGILWRLPFHALIARDGRHVIERTPLFYAASMRTLALAAAASPSSEGLGELFALGDPKLSAKAAAEAVAFRRDAQVGALPDALHEVQTIRRLYPAAAAKVLVGAAASEDAFKRDAARYRVLHVATHGLFDERAPMYSALLLSAPADGSEDGFLEAREIANLSLRSDVAILSACDTARGRYGAGEGLIGMSWALQVAGCPTAIVSQWKAASAPTARLMIAFHRHLLTGASKSESLRRASMELMRTKKYAHPFYWAPFVLVGAP